jgi:DNA-binding response OmpR family regulator
MASENGDRKERTVLVAVVDDHVYTVTSITNFLESLGFRTIWAYNGKDCIKLCKEKSPDILLLDMHLPDMPAFEVAKVLPAAQKFIFMVSSEDVEDYTQKFKNCLGFMKKPIDFGDLEDRLRKIFNIKKTEY